MKKYSFYFHYNKPASLKAGRTQLSVHFRDTCYIIDGIHCSVPIQSKNRKIQPRCVMVGQAEKFDIIHTFGIKNGYIS
jgi:hypothetical protein